jgi:hypothetical protein
LSCAAFGFIAAFSFAAFYFTARWHSFAAFSFATLSLAAVSYSTTQQQMITIIISQFVQLGM